MMNRWRYVHPWIKAVIVVGTLAYMTLAWFERGTIAVVWDVMVSWLKP